MVQLQRGEGLLLSKDRLSIICSTNLPFLSFHSWHSLITILASTGPDGVKSDIPTTVSIVMTVFHSKLSQWISFRYINRQIRSSSCKPTGSYYPQFNYLYWFSARLILFWASNNRYVSALHVLSDDILSTCPPLKLLSSRIPKIQATSLMDFSVLLMLLKVSNSLLQRLSDWHVFTSLFSPGNKPSEDFPNLTANC